MNDFGDNPADDHLHRPISIGSIEGGSINSTKHWRESIRILTRRLNEAKKGAISPLNVNVVFHVPGHIVKPDFTGVRTGTYSRKRALLMVQAAVPEELPADPDGLLQTLLLDAVDAAEQFARDRHICSDLGAIRAVVAGTH